MFGSNQNTSNSGFGFGGTANPNQQQQQGGTGTFGAGGFGTTNPTTTGILHPTNSLRQLSDSTAFGSTTAFGQPRPPANTGLSPLS